jgi:hypothetical protein
MDADVPHLYDERAIALQRQGLYGVFSPALGQVVQQRRWQTVIFGGTQQHVVNSERNF